MDPTTSLETYQLPDNIFAETQRELEDYYHKYVHIAGKINQESARYLDTKNRKFMFNQWEMLNMIDFYYNSHFESGPYDSEGQRKLFLNIVKFRADVASKMINLQVKDFLFTPEEGVNVWPAYLMQKEFHQWAKENYFGELLDRIVDMLPRYGTVVLKEVKGDLEFVPLQTLRNEQDAKDLETARYVIIEHPKMSREDMAEHKNWDLKGIDLEPGQTEKVYERYGLVRMDTFKRYKGLPVNDDDKKKVVNCLTILTLRRGKEDKIGGNVLFIEELDKRPFVEVHWDRQHGRWMGIGEVELQMEHQIGVNMAHNLFRRQLLWSSKKIFQSADEGIARNLVKDVRDGDVLQVSPNGNVTAVDMSNRAIGDFQQFSKDIQTNADQMSFTFEVATGDNLPSGTPFRLGVMLSQAVQSHFARKRDRLGLFLKHTMREKIIPRWRQMFQGEHLVSMFADEEGFNSLREIVHNWNVTEEIKNALTQGKVPDIQAIHAHVDEHLDKARYLFVKIPDSFYNDIDFSVNLTITGDDVDIGKKVETLTNLYTILAQQQDPRAESVLRRILSLTGENYDVVAGKPPQRPQGLPGPGGAGNPMAGSLLGTAMTPPQGQQGSMPAPTINPNAMPARSAKRI